jgi:hypothetical protein
LISIAVYAKITAVLTSLPILGAVVTCGVFLLIISIFGLIGAVRHQLVILFFVSFSSTTCTMPKGMLYAAHLDPSISCTNKDIETRNFVGNK